MISVIILQYKFLPSSSQCKCETRLIELISSKKKRNSPKETTFTKIQCVIKLSSLSIRKK